MVNIQSAKIILKIDWAVLLLIGFSNLQSYVNYTTSKSITYQCHKCNDVTGKLFEEYITKHANILLFLNNKPFYSTTKLVKPKFLLTKLKASFFSKALLWACPLTYVVEALCLVSNIEQVKQLLHSYHEMNAIYSMSLLTSYGTFHDCRLLENYTQAALCVLEI